MLTAAFKVNVSQRSALSRKKKLLETCKYISLDFVCARYGFLFVFSYDDFLNNFLALHSFFKSVVYESFIGTDCRLWFAFVRFTFACRPSKRMVRDNTYVLLVKAVPCKQLITFTSKCSFVNINVYGGFTYTEKMFLIPT